MTTPSNPYADPLDAAFDSPSAGPRALARARALPRGRSRLSARAERRTARSRAGARRPGPGAGRRRHRQDARAHHPPRPYPRHPPRLAQPDPGRDLHQQGGARNEGAHRRPHRRHRRRHAMAGHVPFHRRAHPAPPCRAGRAEIELHHPGSGRSAAPDQTGDRGGEHRREALARAHAGDVHRRLEESRAVARPTFPKATRRPSPSARGARSMRCIRRG